MQNETIKVQNKNEWTNCASSSTRWSLKSPIRSSRKVRVRWPSSSGGWPEPRSGRPGFRLPATDLKILNGTTIVNHFKIIGQVASSTSTRWSHVAIIRKSNLTRTQSKLLCQSVVSFFSSNFLPRASLKICHSLVAMHSILTLSIWNAEVPTSGSMSSRLPPIFV